MKQIEFEDALRQIKEEYKKETAGIRRQIDELQVQIDSLGHSAHEILTKRKGLQQQKSALNIMLNNMAEKHREKVTKFREESWTQERKLSEVSDYCLVNELVSRGFSGTIRHDGKDEEFIKNLNAKFIDGGGTLE